MRLIFIEGVSGVGKSTTVSNLGKSLSDFGYSVKCHYEGDYDSALDLCWVSYITPYEYEKLLDSFPEEVDKIVKNTLHKGDYVLVRYQTGRTSLFCTQLHQLLHDKEFCYNPQNKLPILKFTEVYSMMWRCFGDSNSSYDYEIFDASLVSHMTNDLMRNNNASSCEIANHLNTLLAFVSDYSPIVFYLYSDNIRNRLINARICRKQPPLNEEKIVFWQKRNKVDSVVLPMLSAPVVMCDVSNNNWTNIENQIFRRLTNNITSTDK
ncbi:hypothetical protein SDC9_101762 [bioreactor metagenome]|uniref:Deoxynucleoside kinase domain-containing protein n=1 Tax=bioreactor metagenome TaxID=1076179 RepID=A0A645AP82_9ZZZZ|nr:hypothetical protein [Oscillospiraceae bacterium]